MDSEDKSQEFVAGKTITLTMNLSSEQQKFFREWSLSVPTLYMLDICVVSTTKLTSASLEKNPRKSKIVSYLRELDRPTNGFSYLFALMEKVSDTRGIDSDEELKKKILSDLSCLRSFFKEARIVESDDFVIGFLNKLRGNPIETKRADYLDFLRYLNDELKLGDPVTLKKRLFKAGKIIEKAESIAIYRHHLVVIIGLACLYGNLAAKKLMKFKANPQNFDAENVLADIMLISRFADIKLQIEHNGRIGKGYPRSDFITDDNGLLELIKCFKPTVVKHKDKNDGRETELTMDVSLKDILTEIQPEEYSSIFGLLNQT